MAWYSNLLKGRDLNFGSKTQTKENTEPAENTDQEEETSPSIEENGSVEETGTVEESGNIEETGNEPDTNAADAVSDETVAETANAEETGTVAETGNVEETGNEPDTNAADAASDETVEETGNVEETGIVAESENIEENIEENGTEADADEVFRYFREISAIPHGSFHTEALSDYLEQFAVGKNLSCTRDEMGNVIIRKPASQGCEGAAPIALQGHIDMVCEKDDSNPIDMDKEAITLIEDGDWLRADGTTLGADDGIAVAMMLALLSDESLVSPPLECIFTVDEEVGLLGAAALDLSSLKSRRLVNLDSESEGIITVACAGGAEQICSLKGRRRVKKGRLFEIEISGLRGGHSGEAIGLGRANADLLMTRLLHRLEDCGKYSLVSFSGGTRDNAIPRSARAQILFTGKKLRRDPQDTVESFSKDVLNEFSHTDPEIRIRSGWIREAAQDDTEAVVYPDNRVQCSVFTRKSTRRMVRFLMAMPNGVMEYTPQDGEVPQTSLSLGIVTTTAEGLRTHSLVRSSINSRKQMLLDRIRCIVEVFGAEVETEGAYPAWEHIEESPFRDLAAQVWKKTTGSPARICVIHGGLECGLIAARVPGIECISVGPDLEDVHTPSERMNIPSAKRVYAYIRELLKECAGKDPADNQTKES